MKNKEFLTLEKGRYELTDGIWNYEMIVDYCEDKSKIFQIKQLGSLSDSNIAIFKRGKEVSIMAKVGGICVHSDNCFDIINNLKLINP